MLKKRVNILKVINILTLVVMLTSFAGASAQGLGKRSGRTTVSGGMFVGSKSDSTELSVVDSLAVDSLRERVIDSLRGHLIDSLRSLSGDSLVVNNMLTDSILINSMLTDSMLTDSMLIDSKAVDSLMSSVNAASSNFANANGDIEAEGKKFKLFSDSTSLSAMCWTAAVLPGYGQIYNKQYWKLPILYGTLGASIALYVNENKKYQPLKERYDELTLTNLQRDDEIDALQGEMIKSNTRRQLYMGAMAASYIYFLGDAAVNYATDDVSSVKKATTLAMICPGAGQIYNGSYWKLPFVVGGFATMIYVIDWNNRGYVRFKKAYSLRYDYDENPDDYPDGSSDEFGGRYTASYLKSLRNSYRRNRDLCIIMTAGLYVLQIIDAHVDAHLRDYDISDDLTMNIDPLIQSDYSYSMKKNCMTYGFNINLRF